MKSEIIKFLVGLALGWGFAVLIMVVVMPLSINCHETALRAILLTWAGINIVNGLYKKDLFDLGVCIGPAIMGIAL